MRRGRVFRRCTDCGSTVAGKRCACGSDRASWAFQVDLNAIGERRRQAKRSGFATKTAAVAAMADLQAAASAGKSEPTKMSTGEFLDEWLPTLKARGSTVASYELIIRRHLKPALGAVALRHLTRTRIKEAYAGLEAKGLSDKSVHNAHVVLRRALAEAVEDGLIVANPASKARRLGHNRAPLNVWDDHEAAAFLRGVAADRLYAMWRLAVVTGMRRGELLGLRWSDIDLGGGFVAVEQQRSRQGAAGVVVGTPKTRAGRRRIPIDAATVGALRQHRRSQLVAPIDGLAFTGADGSPLDPDVVSQSFNALVARIGVSRIRLHDVRHTAATLMLRAGVHPKVVQERLGHASIGITLDLYSHAVPSMAVEAADRLAALVDAAT